MVPAKELQLDRKRFVAATKYEVKESSDEVTTNRKGNHSYPKAKHRFQSWWYAYKMLFGRREIGTS